MARQAKKELISQREYARRLGVSHVAVQRAVKTGRISTVGGKIDPCDQCVMDGFCMGSRP